MLRICEKSYFCIHLSALFGVAKVSPSQKTYYQILELPKTATQKNIRKNYLRLVKIYHPDVYKGRDKKRFQKLQKAYQVLSNSHNRKTYDQTLKNQLDQSKQYEQQQKKYQEKQDEDKPKNQFSYNDSNQSKDQTINIDEQYNQFFNKKSKTHFQEIRLHQQIQFRSMSEEERIRFRFKQLYTNEGELAKMYHQKAYQDILNDQIKQSNENLQQQSKRIQKIKKMYEKNSIFWQKVLISFLMITTSFITFPVSISIWTKYKLELESKATIEELGGRIQEKMAQIQIRSRFIY